MSAPGLSSPPPAAPHPRAVASSTFAASFSCALTGLVEAVSRERNLRIHLAAGVLASCFAAVAPLSAAERAIVLLCVALVIAAEAANSALEAVVDLLSPEWDERARIAKDAAAGAVLALAAGSVVVFVTIAPSALSRALMERPNAPIAALGAAVAAGVLPTEFRRSRTVDLALLVGAFACLLSVARNAESYGGVAAAALLVCLAGEAARRRRRIRAPEREGQLGVGTA